MKILFFLFLCLGSNFLMAQDQSLDTFFKELDPEIGVSMQLMDTDGQILYAQNDTVTIPAASTIKLPILVEFYYQVEQKRFKIKQKYKLQEADKVGGSGEMQFNNPMTEYSYAALAGEMIRVSDNTATNILIDKLGLNNVNNMLAFHGFEKTKLRRKMMDFQAVLEGKQNTTTAAEMNSLIYKIYKEELMKTKNHQAIINTLKKCEDFTTFRAQLPGVTIAHKTGTLDNLRADVGIIYGQKPIILSVYVQNFESIEQAEKIIADIAAMAFQTYAN